MAKRKSSSFDPLGLALSMISDTPSSKKTERKTPSKKEKDALYVLQHGRCMCCGIKLDIAHMHSDHKIPVARNGSNAITNKQLLCGPCNTRKGKKTDGEFRKRYPFLVPTSNAKSPPSKAIPQSVFRERDAELKKKAGRKAKSKKDEGGFGFSFFSE